MLPESVRRLSVATALAAWDEATVVDARLDRGELTLEILPDSIVEVCAFLKHDQKFERLSAVTAVDRYPMTPRFEIVYHLHSLSRKERLRLKCRVDSGIASVTSIWASANWYEREVFDLFGVAFAGHPDLTRILMPESWEGHPLRKDFPVHGHKYSYQHE